MNADESGSNDDRNTSEQLKSKHFPFVAFAAHDMSSGSGTESVQLPFLPEIWLASCG